MKLPQIDVNQVVTYKLLEEIQERVSQGYRLRSDFEILLNFAKKQLEEVCH
jgi:hypothetical protein